MPDQADFSGIGPQKPLYVSKILQKAVIEINEAGSEAAAATVFLSRDMFYPNFNCNRPFVFIIHDRRNVLFIGKINNPNKL
jgi:serpin B